MISYYFHIHPTLGQHAVTNFKDTNAGVQWMDGLAGICVTEYLFKIETFLDQYGVEWSGIHRDRIWYIDRWVRLPKNGNVIYLWKENNCPCNVSSHKHHVITPPPPPPPPPPPMNIIISVYRSSHGSKGKVYQFYYLTSQTNLGHIEWIWTENDTPTHGEEWILQGILLSCYRPIYSTQSEFGLDKHLTSHHRQPVALRLHRFAYFQVAA